MVDASGHLAKDNADTREDWPPRTERGIPPQRRRQGWITNIRRQSEADRVGSEVQRCQCLWVDAGGVVTGPQASTVKRAVAEGLDGDPEPLVAQNVRGPKPRVIDSTSTP